MLTAADIVTFDDTPPPPGSSPWVDKGPQREVAVVDYDPTWPNSFEQLASRLRGALGATALAVEHVGSTSVPGLPAKPIIDVDLTVPDSANEDAWLPPLEAAGFSLQIREPWWYGHRCLTASDPAANIHVFSPDCAEVARHRIFRDWLRTQPQDRELYRDAKLAAAEAANAGGEHVMQYNARKQQVIRAIYHRAFVAAGLLP